MIENNNHPFIHEVRDNFAPICTGYQSIPTNGKDAGDIIAKRLRTCKNVLMYGYGDYGRRYQLVKGGYYDAHIRTKSELEKKGVLIIQGGKKRW